MLARAVEQTSSVTIHQNSIISVDTPTGGGGSNAPTDDPEKQATTEEQKLSEERVRQTEMSESARQEAHQIMAECYLNLANCVLNGGQRNPEDYKRVQQYCDNVIIGVILLIFFFLRF